MPLLKSCLKKWHGKHGGEAGLEVKDLDSVQPKTQRMAVLDIREEELGVA